MLLYCAAMIVCIAESSCMSPENPGTSGMTMTTWNLDLLFEALSDTRCPIREDDHSSRMDCHRLHPPRRVVEESQCVLVRFVAM